MYKYIHNQLKLHCIVYGYNYEEKLQEFLNNDGRSPLIKEFMDIYNKEDLKNYNTLLNNFFKTIEKGLKGVARDEKEIKSIAMFFTSYFNGFPFLSWFISFSLLNGLLYEKFSYERRIEKNNVEIIDLINYVYNDLMLLIDFLYVSDIFEKNKNNFKERSIKKFLFRLIVHLKNADILIFKKITVLKEKRGDLLRYANMVEFEGYTRPKSLTYLFRIGNEPATLKKKKNTLLIGFYHYSLNTYLISEKKNKEKSEIRETFTKAIMNLANTSFFIDESMLNIVSQRVDQLKQDDIGNTLKALKIKHAIKSKEIEKIENCAEIINELNYLKYQIKTLQKKLSFGIDTWIFDEFRDKYKNCKTPLYFVPYADFRGRTYLKSLVSPQAGWMFRFVYNFGELHKLEEDDLGVLVLTEEVKNLLKFNNFNDNLNTYAWVFLSIGFKFKKNIKLTDGKIKINDFIIMGVEKYIKYATNFFKLFDEMDNMDAAETIYYITLITDLRNSRLKKRYLIKDTTASVYQHLGKILLFKNEKALEITNIKNTNEWHDTYEPLISELKNDLDPETKDFFCRKNLKSIFITTKYNVGRGSALEYYLNETSFIEDRGLFKKIIKNFNKIYDNLKKGKVEQEILYKMSLEEFNKKVLNYKIIELGDISISLSYFKLIKKEITVFVNKNRYTMVNYELSDTLDTPQMQIAALPHIVHGLDALYARRIINLLKEFDVEIFTIHDAFAVPFNQIDLLIISAWDSIRIDEKFNFIEKTNPTTKVDSITIII